MLIATKTNRKGKKGYFPTLTCLLRKTFWFFLAGGNGICIKYHATSFLVNFVGLLANHFTSQSPTFSSVKWVYTVPILPTFQCGREVQTDPVWMLPAAFTLYPWPSNCDDVYGGSDQLCPIYLPKLTTWFIDLFLQFQTFEFPQEKRYHQRV